MKRFVWLFAAVSVSLIAWILLTNRYGQVPSGFGSEVDPNKTPDKGTLILGYIMTLFGAVLGAMFREMQSIRQRGVTTVNPGQFLRNTLLSTDLWLSILSSPIAFAVIWRSLDGNNMPSLITVAVQNGLFCTVIAGSFMAKSPQSNNLGDATTSTS